MKVLENTWGIAPSPALKTLCQILEKYDEKDIHRCRKYSQSFANFASRISEVSDLRIRMHILSLVYEDHVKSINVSIIPNEAKSFLLNIIAKHNKQKRKEWNEIKKKITANKQRASQLLKNKQKI